MEKDRCRKCKSCPRAVENGICGVCQAHIDNARQAQVKDSIRFSNFAQQIKMKYWENPPNGNHITESQLDEILLLAWEDCNKSIKTARKEGAMSVIQQIPNKLSDVIGHGGMVKLKQQLTSRFGKEE